jgi:hypothetical protein
MKVVIFIGSTSRSGSTMMERVLAGVNQSLALGEIQALFHPTKKHHFDGIDKVMQMDPRWGKVISGGGDRLYVNLFKYFPEINIFIDSSKNPLWISKHERVLKNISGVSFINLLIYKTPIELANSYYKRNLVDAWPRMYINYHRKYLSTIPVFYCVKYKDLTETDNALAYMVSLLNINNKGNSKAADDIPYGFFGSSSVRRIDPLDKMTYDEPVSVDMKLFQKQIEENPLVNRVVKELDNHDNLSKIHDKLEDRKLVFGKLQMLLFQLKWLMKPYISSAKW